MVCMYGGTTREDPEYPGILSIPNTGCVVCMYGGTTRRIPSIPGYLVFRTLGTSQVSLAFWLLGMWCVCVGGQLGRILCDLSKVHVHI